MATQHFYTYGMGHIKNPYKFCFSFYMEILDRQMESAQKAAPPGSVSHIQK